MRKLLSAALLVAALALSTPAGIIGTGDGMYCDTESGYCCNPRQGECPEGFEPDGSSAAAEPADESEPVSEFFAGLLAALGF